MRKFAFALLCALSTTPPSAFAAPKVVVSILPLHSLVASVMQDVQTPVLLMKGQNSEHNASFTPQQLLAIEQSDVVFLVGDTLETKLSSLSGTEVVNGKTFVKLSETPGLILHAVRQGGTWEPDSDEPPPSPNTIDPHLWLDPENAKTMVKYIAGILQTADPPNAATYAKNAETTLARLAALESTLKTQLTPLQHKPFIVFHDAYQYFERRFGLTSVGSISNFAASPPSAQRLGEIRSKILSTHAKCVFREPQFNDAAVQTVIEGTEAKTNVLDPIGATLTPGPDAYEKLLSGIADHMTECLS
ncbi:MAG: zinc ABC transporter substrate-binding protein [Alphaproteobacteria bacterium]|nr:zinc ABC transporter substrate-binding protein [Alphaproteobacteria bacterium]